jgi:curved DNA-binding protein CbpA
MKPDAFIDCYEVLQVSPNADLETIERVYRFLAKRYHPDNPRTGNEERFRTVQNAYETLSNPENRSSYDARYEGERAFVWQVFGEASSSDEMNIETDKRIQQSILTILYITRRKAPSTPGVGSIELERMLGVPEAHLEFHIWYLKEKGWIERSDTGKLVISVSGVEAVIEKSFYFRKDRLLTEGKDI